MTDPSAAARESATTSTGGAAVAISGSDLTGAVVLITGAAGGIGSATARAFSDRGSSLVLVDVDEPRLLDLAAALKETGCDGSRIMTVVADVGNEAVVQDYMSATVDRFGSLDVLVNNAGVEGDVALAHEYSGETFDRVMYVNVRSVWLNTKHAVLAMRRLNIAGRVVNIGSAVSLIGARELAPYTASKHAVLGLTRATALELASAGIRVNAVCPGPTDTRMQRCIEMGLAADPEEAHDDIVKLIPLGRYGRPDEIAQVVVFLASSVSSFMTGAAVSVDGAMTAG